MKALESKTNLLLLHGALGSSATFAPLKIKLSEQYNVCCPDFRWHGYRTELGDSFTMKNLVADLKQILDNENKEKWICFGYSMGAYVAMSLALENPQYFDGIMSYGTKLDWHPEQAERETKMLNPDKISEKVPAFANQLEHHHGENWKLVCLQTAEMMKALGNQPLLTPNSANSLKLPIRITVGDTDKMVSVEESLHFCRSLPAASFQVFPDSGHGFETLDMDNLVAAITDFVAKTKFKKTKTMK